MPNRESPAPRHYPGVMVSSTFTDLEQHRAALIKAIKGQGLTDLAMENDSAKPDVDVLESSLRMVQDGAAYVGVISRKYGQIPPCPKRNPDELSLTELEFNEAQRLGRPILLFIMGDKHQLLEADVELDEAKRKKLHAFRERAKQMGPDSLVHRVYATFNNLEEFTAQAIQAVSALRAHLDEASTSAAQAAPVIVPVASPYQPDPIPKPPAFYAEPPYIGSHQFVGRQAQLDVLSDWADQADPHPVLLFDAIGGSGKSMLTWQWTTKHATQIRKDWAGRFWYSFYERGAIMADFCQRALAYITGQPLEAFRKKKTLELSDILLHHLRDKPWLLVLDGLERVLVAYHRFDAAQVPDEEANQPTDKIAERDPCAAIRPEDDDLLRALAAAAPSKLLITSRLIPRVLLNPANQPIPGVRREVLQGLRPSDAEELLRSCGIKGDSQAIQRYLQSHCDCHPLVTGILAGLINNYLPDKGNFDTWVGEPRGGGQLNLADLDLVQKRNHILKAAFAALPEKGHQLLSTLALLSEAVDYPTLSALNPHLPPEPEEVEVPRPPESSPAWEGRSNGEKKEALTAYREALERRKAYEHAREARLESREFREATGKLSETISDLERRGLLQYDCQSKRWDLHPVVRGIAAGALSPEQNAEYGQRVVDHFSQQSHRPYEEAESLDDLRAGLHVVRTLMKMGRYQEAADVYRGDLGNALFFNIGGYAETLTLLRPLFPEGWGRLPDAVTASAGGYLACAAGGALRSMGEAKESLVAHEASLLVDLENVEWQGLQADLQNISLPLQDLNRLARADRSLRLALDLADCTSTDDPESLFSARLYVFVDLVVAGRWAEAEAMWQLLDPMGRNWHRAAYRPGDAEFQHASLVFRKGELNEEQIAKVEKLATAGRNRWAIREVAFLRGQWRLEQGQWDLAEESLHQAVCMARASGRAAPRAETSLALAQFHLGRLSNPREAAEHLAKAKDPAHLPLAELWLAIGDHEQAKKHALAAYKWAWADGEPYVHRYELDKTRALLKKLGVEIPNLPPYDPAKDEKFPWEDKVAAAIEKLRADRQAKDARGAEEKRNTTTS